MYKNNFGWCEKLVDVHIPNETLPQGRLILDKNEESHPSGGSLILNKNDTFTEIKNELKFVYSNKSPKIDSILKPAETFRYMNISDNDSYEISLEG